MSHIFSESQPDYLSTTLHPQNGLKALNRLRDGNIHSKKLFFTG